MVSGWPRCARVCVWVDGWTQLLVHLPGTRVCESRYLREHLYTRGDPAFTYAGRSATM